jgi:hypothetical protein
MINQPNGLTKITCSISYAYLNPFPISHFYKSQSSYLSLEDGLGGHCTPLFVLSDVAMLIKPPFSALYHSLIGILGWVAEPSLLGLKELGLLL